MFLTPGQAGGSAEFSNDDKHTRGSQIDSSSGFYGGKVVQIVATETRTDTKSLNVAIERRR